MSTSTGRTGPRYILIDAFRGIACLAVVLYHAKEGGHLDALLMAMPHWFDVLLSHGDSGVSIFFVISGFVIANSMLREEVSGPYVGRFLVRRSLRLDPPYWAAIALAVLISYMAARAIPGRAFEPPSLPNLLLHVTYLVDLAGQPLISPVYWTLCIEIQFYLSFALLMWLATSLGRRIGRARARDLILFVCAVLAALWTTPYAPFHVHALFVENWYPFIVGVLVRRALDEPRPGAATIAAVAYIVVLELLLVLPDGGLHGTVGLIAAVIILVAGHRGFLASMSGGRLLQWLGLISYSLYLTHNAVLGIGFRVAYRLMGRTPLTQSVALLLVLIACCLFAWLFFQSFERLGLYLSKKVALHRAQNADQSLQASVLLADRKPF